MTPDDDSRPPPDALVKALDKAIARGIADADAGREEPATAVFERLEAKYRAMTNTRRQLPLD